MRTPRLGPALAGAASLALIGSLSTAAVAADSDPRHDPVPSRAEVRDAQEAASAGARDVAAVQGDLEAARARTQESSVAAARAAEAYNGARYRARQARTALAAARHEAEQAEADLARQRAAYADSVVSTYTTSPELTALAAIADADGLEGVLSKTGTLTSVSAALDTKYDAYHAADVRATSARAEADAAADDASEAAAEARTARESARAAVEADAAQERATRVEHDDLVAELARLQGVSAAVAERRQQGLARRGVEAAAAAAQAEQEAAQAEQEAAQEAAQAAQQSGPTSQPATDSTPPPTPTPTPPPAPAPTPTPAPTPAPTPTPAPPSHVGAQAAVDFARAQLGEPYVWAAAGPDSWDCSGLTMGAWKAAGVELPHYSVAQYEQSTPISAGDLRPGDLLFWGDSSDPGSIYHVALYTGDGMMIHAPRTGRPVVEESMYYWITPNFYARP